MIARLDQFKREPPLGLLGARSGLEFSPCRAAQPPVDPPESAVNRGLSFLIGLFLPVLTLQTEYIGTPKDLTDRVMLVDLFLLVMLVGRVLFHRFERLPAFSFVYLAAIGLTACRVFALSMGLETDVMTGAAAMLVAFAYYVLGLQIGASPGLLRWLLLGLSLSALGETVIVYHDAFVPAQWFPDPMPGRARGTFKASGQLAAYSFSAAGILLLLSRSGLRKLWPLGILSGLLLVPYGILASRRSAMIAVAAWALFVLVLAWPFRRELFYRLIAGTVILLVLGVIALWPQVSASFAVKRLEAGVSGLAANEGFIQDQFANTLKSAPEWFPWGFGPGMGKLINRDDVREHEVHDGLLAVTVELGILGLIGYLGTALHPFGALLRWYRRGRDHVQAALLASFLLASFVFVVHNTLYRDRTFLIFLGMITAIARQRAAEADLDGGVRPR